MLLTLTPQSPSAATLTLVNDGASDTGYELLQGASFGSPVWEHQFSAPRGTQGARPSQGRLPNRQVTLPIRVAGATKDAMAVKISAIVAVVDEMRRVGGTCRMRSKSQTRAQNFDVLTATAELPDWNNRLEQRNRAVVVITLTCGPYVLGDPMDVHDDFSTDNVNGGDANYTADAGALTNVAVTGGVLDASANLTTENRLIFTGNGYTYGDTEATIQATPGSTITSFKAGVILKRVDDENYLAVYVDDNGSNSRLRIDKVVAGSTTNLASTNLGARVVNGTRLWIRGRIEGNVVYAEHFLTTNVPNPIVAPTTTNSVILTTAEADVLGADIEGRAGIVFTPQQTAAFLDDFEVLPFTYRNPPNATLDCAGAIPGDAPALTTARMAMPTSGLTKADWALLSWCERPAVENLVTFGGERNSVRWVVSAVSGVTGAATSTARVEDSTLGAGAKYGDYVRQIVCPATANTGASYAIYRHFRAGQTYTATAWVRASSGTTNVRIRLGVSGDIASSTAVALSTTWTQHTATWTPATSTNIAYFAAEVTAATATTWQIDGVAVYAGTTAPAVGPHLYGDGAAAPLTVVNAVEYAPIIGTMASVAYGTANGGTALGDTSVDGAGQTYTIQALYLDPSLIPPDDYTQDSLAVEVYARVLVSSAFTGGVTLSIFATPGGSNGYVVPSEDFGANGKTVVLPSSGNDIWRLVRLGSLNLSSVSTAGSWQLVLEADVAAGTNSQDFAIDDIYIIPLRARIAMPTGKTNAEADVTDYPVFLSSATSYRTIAPDLSSSVTIGSQTGPAGGVNGSLLELPPGPIRVYSLISSEVPDDPTGNAADEGQASASLHLGIQPRWHWLRDS